MRAAAGTGPPGGASLASLGCTELGCTQAPSLGMYFSTSQEREGTGA